MPELACPACGSVQWKAIEQRSFLVPCSLIRNGTEIEIEIDPMAEFFQESSIGFTSGYICSNEDCRHTVSPQGITELKEAASGSSSKE